MLKTTKVKAKDLTIDSRVAVETGDPLYTKSTRGLTKRSSYVLVDVESISKGPDGTLVLEVKADDLCAVGVIFADMEEDVEVVNKD